MPNDGISAGDGPVPAVLLPTDWITCAHRCNEKMPGGAIRLAQGQCHRHGGEVLRALASLREERYDFACSMASNDAGTVRESILAIWALITTLSTKIGEPLACSANIELLGGRALTIRPSPEC